MAASSNFWSKDWRFLAGKGKYYPESRGFPVFTTLSVGTRVDITSDAVIQVTSSAAIRSFAVIGRPLHKKPFYIYNTQDQKFRQPTVVASQRDVGIGMGATKFRIF